MEIHPFKEAHLPELVALQNRLAPIRRHMSVPTLKDALMDSTREGGKNVCLAYDGADLSGFLAWVEGNYGEFFGSPFVASSETVAQALMDILLKQANAKNWIRVSAFPEETGKIFALKDRAFAPAFEFVEFEANLSNHQDAILPDGISDQLVTEMHPAEFARLNNDAFVGVDNSLPIDNEEAKEILSSPLLDPALSRIWRNQSGEALAFSLGNKDGYLDAIGLIPSAQRKGIGTQLYTWILSQAAKNGFSRVFTTVSSRNEGSLRLHRRLGINEVERRTVWEKKLLVL